MTHAIWQRILVPHDFSPSANHAAALARDEAKQHGGTLILLHVIDLPPQFGPDTTLLLSGADKPPISMRQYAMTAASAHLEDLAGRLRADGIAVEVAIQVGTPVDEINRVAVDRCATSIVMGTHGRTGFKRLAAGSVTERVVRSATIPVMTIRHSA